MLVVLHYDKMKNPFHSKPTAFLRPVSMEKDDLHSRGKKWSSTVKESKQEQQKACLKRSEAVYAK